jgi:hypothetical protein
MSNIAARLGAGRIRIAMWKELPVGRGAAPFAREFAKKFAK